jgi:hypothetical protein
MSLRFLGSAAAALLATISAAQATTQSMSLGYTAVPVANNPSYAPTINDDGQSFLEPGTETMTVGMTSTPTTFLQIAPVNGGSSVGTQMGAIDVVLTLMMGANNSPVTSVSTSAGGNQATLSNGKISFQAYYELFYAANPQTDCLVWNGTSCSANNNTTTIGETVTAKFADGAVLAINLYNWSDWDMTPQISFDLISGANTSVPEPGSLAVLGSAIGGLAVLRRRRQRAG